MSQDAITAVKLRCSVRCEYDGFFARLLLRQKDATTTTILEAQQFIKNVNYTSPQAENKCHVALVYTLLLHQSMELLLVLMQLKISCLLLACFESLIQVVRLRKQPRLHWLGVPVRVLS
jgi:hypothetical protein